MLFVVEPQCCLTLSSHLHSDSSAASLNKLDSLEDQLNRTSVGVESLLSSRDSMIVSTSKAEWDELISDVQMMIL